MGKSGGRRPVGYAQLLRDLSERVRSSQLRAAASVNSELVLLYWSIGRDILDRQERLGWGAKVIEQLASDLARELPGSRGFSSRNLKYMRSFAQAWPDRAIVQAPLAQLPWYHNLALLEKLKAPDERLWYARKAIEKGWSRDQLVAQIQRQLLRAEGAARSNFSATLPGPQSALAQEALKDPYKLDFLSLSDDAQERAIERGLVRHIRDFLLELGQGFAFVGSQVPLRVGSEDFRIDLLFYHLELRAFIVLELKAGRFRPEHMGKLSFYLSAVDELMRHPDDRPSIGLVLCRDRDATVAEYALRGATQPMAIAEYELTRVLPAELEGALPSIEELEAEFAADDGEGVDGEHD